MCYFFFTHSSVDGHLGCFHVLAIVNSAAINIMAHDFFGIMVFSEYMPSSGIVGSYGSSIFIFLMNHHNVLHSGCINFHSPTVQEGSLFSTPSAAFTVCWFIYYFTLLFFFFLWLHWVFVAVCRFSLVTASRSYSSLQCVGLSLWWLLLCRAWALGKRASVVVAREL